jgi:hypothetical protein
VLSFPSGRAGALCGPGPGPICLRLADAALPVGLVVAVGEALRAPVLDEPALAHPQPLRSAARDRLGALRALPLEPLLCLAQPGPASLAASQVLGQLVAAGEAMQLVLGGVDLAGLFDDLRGDLLVAADRVVGSGGRELAAVNRNDPDRDEPGIGAQPEDLAEQRSQRRLVTDAEARHRGVIGHLVGRDHPERDILAAATLDPPRGALPDCVRRRRAAPPSSAGHAPRRPSLRGDRPNRRRRGRARRRRRARTRPDDPPVATRAVTAARAAPDRDHRAESSGPPLTSPLGKTNRRGRLGRKERLSGRLVDRHRATCQRARWRGRASRAKLGAWTCLRSP